MTHNLIYGLITFLTGLGIGAIVSAVIKRNFEQKKLIFEIKLIKYSNLIDAYHNAVVNNSEQTKQKYVSAQKQVELIGTDEVIQLSEEFYKRPHSSSTNIRDNLIKAMRKDLVRYYRSAE